METLSYRARTVLERANITTKEQAAAAIDRLPQYRGTGPATLAEIRKWAGLPIVPPKPKRPEAGVATAQLRCPCCNATLTVDLSKS